jgi:hypothetical protein
VEIFQNTSTKSFVMRRQPCRLLGHEPPELMKHVSLEYYLPCPDI